MTSAPEGKIFHLLEGGGLAVLEEEPFSEELLLQKLIAAHPALLPGDRIDPIAPRRFLLVDRELTVAGDATTWFVDHLFIDQDGTPTLVEVKKGSNPELRRKVVGQMLDYAANAPLAWPEGSLRKRFDQRCAIEHIDPVAAVTAAFGDEVNADELWASAEKCLREHKLRLLFVTDHMVPELRRVVEFLNEQMKSVEVLAVEIRKYTGGGHTTLVPTVFGQTLGTEGKSGGTGAVWTANRFMASLQDLAGPDAVSTATKLLLWCESEADSVFWGKGGQKGSFGPIFQTAGGPVYPFLAWTTGRVQVHFQVLRSFPPFDQPAQRDVLRKRLNELGAELPASTIEGRPNLPLSKLADTGKTELFLKEIHEAVAAIRQADSKGQVTPE